MNDNELFTRTVGGLCFIEEEPGVLCKVGWLDFARRCEDYENRVVARDELYGGKVRVSTVWLGIDHRYGSGPPLIYETMVFFKKTGMSGEYQDRYSYRADALRGHAVALAWARYQGRGLAQAREPLTQVRRGRRRRVAASAEAGRS